jgi:glutathione S-transferase
MTIAKPARLFVLSPSHDCERARCALDHMGLDYTEERWAVGLHVPRARRIARSTTLPILATAPEVIQGSDSIFDWTGIAGYAPALERRFEERIGVLVRQFLHAGTLGVPRSGLHGVLFDGVPAGDAFLRRLMWPVTRRLMVASMNARREVIPELEQERAAERDWFDGQITGGRHLVGKEFGRADLMAASLLAPLARPRARISDAVRPPFP